MKDMKQPWIYSSFVDGIFVLMPPFISLFLIFLFPSYFSDMAEVSVYAWVGLILLIDVGHVYSTLYRTYFDKETFTSQKSLLIYTPLFAWIISVMLYEFDAMLFWKFIAYLAVFHFIRQQYGFMRIYSRKEHQVKMFSIIDTIAIYSATVYPLLYWHLNSPRNFHWFIEGDFFMLRSERASLIFFCLYVLVILVYLVKESIVIIKQKYVNLPRNLIIAGTFLSWYVGIVYYNGDLIFTMLNVVSHGIPYIALVWIYGRKKYGAQKKSQGIMKRLHLGYGVLGFIFFIGALAFLEEGIWDAMVWKDHKEIFSFFDFLPTVSDKNILAFLIPLLSVPQLTHYILDGFIWRLSKGNMDFRETSLAGVEDLPDQSV
jgi:hypothetical protein